MMRESISRREGEVCMAVRCGGDVLAGGKSCWKGARWTQVVKSTVIGKVARRYSAT